MSPEHPALHLYLAAVRIFLEIAVIIGAMVLTEGLWWAWEMFEWLLILPALWLAKVDCTTSSHRSICRIVVNNGWKVLILKCILVFLLFENQREGERPISLTPGSLSNSPYGARQGLKQRARNSTWIPHVRWQQANYLRPYLLHPKVHINRKLYQKWRYDQALWYRMNMPQAAA